MPALLRAVAGSCQHRKAAHKRRFAASLGLLAALVLALAAGSASAATGCFALPSACGYPDATNVGPSGTLTPSGSITATTNGQVIEGKDIVGSVTIAADNVTIRNSRVMTKNSGSTAVININNGADNFTLEDSEVGGNGSATNAPESGVWNHYNNPGAKVIGSYIHGSPDNWEGRVDLVKDSYMVVDASLPGSHDENIYVWCTTVNVDHSTLINHHEQTATVFGDTLGCGGNKFTVTNSLLAGGGFTLYSQAAGESHAIPDAQTVVTGNRFARCLGATKYNSGSGGTTCQAGPDSNGAYPYGGYFGLAAGFNGPTTWSGNVWDDNSQPVCVGGNSGCGTTTPPPPPPPPADVPADAVWTVPSGATVGSPVTLKGSASTGDAPLICSWSFEDQSGSTILDTRTGCQISYTFQQAGEQYVRLTVTDADGDTDFSRQSFSVAPASTPPPTETPADAVWTAPSEATVGVPVTLDGSASTGGPPLNCTWSFENQSGTVVWETHEGCVLQFTFSQVDVKYIELIVQDGNGDIDSNRQSFPVAAATPPPPPPADTPANAVWTAPSGATVGVPVTLKGGASTGDAPLTCSWSFENQSGSTILDTRSGCQINYTFQQAGTQYLRLTVTDADGDTDFSRQSFSVAPAGSNPPTPPKEPQPPTGGNPPARALWSAPTNVRQGQRVTLDGSASQGSRPLRCVWTIENSTGSRVFDRRTGCRIGYRFHQAGTQYVRLTIYSSDGQSDDLQRSIRVAASTSLSGAVSGGRTVVLAKPAHR